MPLRREALNWKGRLELVRRGGSGPDPFYRGKNLENPQPAPQSVALPLKLAHW
jgi:hypothetical protein